MGPAFYAVHDDDVLHPGPCALSGWGTDHLRGMAVSGAMARAAQREVACLGRADLLPARWTVDLFRAARRAATTTSVTVVRHGRRLCLVDVHLAQDGRRVARGSALFLAPSQISTGPVWSPDMSIVPPPRDFPRSPDVERLYRSGDGDWSPPQFLARDSDRKHLWQYPVAIVDGEEPTGFELAASVADAANAVVNQGIRGLEFINADVTMTLARAPEGPELGMSALTRECRDGVTVGSALLFDREGSIGTATVCGLANPAQAVDLRQHGRGE